MRTYGVEVGNETVNVTYPRTSSPGMFAIIGIGTSFFPDANSRLRIALFRSTGGVTPTDDAVTKFNQRSPTQQNTPAASWVTNPTDSGSALIREAQNRAGPPLDWLPPRPRATPIFADGEQGSLNNELNLPVTGDVQWIEEPMVPDAHSRPTRRCGRRRDCHVWVNHTNQLMNKTGAGAYEFRAASALAWSTPLPFVVPDHIPDWMQRFGIAAETETFFLTADGITDPVGALVKRVEKPSAGSTSPAGNLQKLVLKTLAGQVNPAGTLAKTILKAFSGATNPSGDLVANKLKTLAVGGVITPVGDLLKQAGKLLAGTVTPAGILLKQVAKVLGGGPALRARGSQTYTSVDFAHSLFWAAGRIFAGTRSDPAKLLRLNDPLGNLADFTVLTYPSDGFHDSSDDALYIASNDRIYQVFFHASRVTVAEVNPTTMAFVDVISDTGFSFGESLATDGTYLYVLTQSVNPAIVLKYRLSDFVRVGNLTLTGRTQGHALRYDAGTGLLFATGASSPGWIARINPADLTYVDQGFAAGENLATDDLALTANHVFVALESLGGRILRFAKLDFNQKVSIDAGAAAASFGMFNDGHRLWAVYDTPANKVSVHDLAGGDSVLFTPGSASGFSRPNEMAFDGAGHAWITQWQFTIRVWALDVVRNDLSPGGGLTKTVLKVLGGTSVPTGALANIRLFVRSFGGVIAPAGALIKTVHKSFAGVVSPTGTLTPTGVVTVIRAGLARAFDAALALARAVSRLVAGERAEARVLDRPLHAAHASDVQRTV